MVDLYQLLQVKHLKISVYHPQTDGLVERYNQTLKQMLRWVVDEDGRHWDLLLHYVLFTVGETPVNIHRLHPVQAPLWMVPSRTVELDPGGFEGAALPLLPSGGVCTMQERINQVTPNYSTTHQRGSPIHRRCQTDIWHANYQELSATPHPVVLDVSSLEVIAATSYSQ